MTLVNSIISWINYKRIYQIELYREHAREIQVELLFDLIGSAKNCEWGKRFDYESMGSLRDFQERVPISTYEQIEPFISQMIEGKKNVLWPGEIKWFAKSSGTTNAKSKFIPVSKESLDECHFQGGKDVLAIYYKNFPENRVLTGKCLTLGGSHRVNSMNQNSFYGDLSAIMIENLPFWTDFHRTPPTEIALIEQFERKIDEIAKTTVHENVTSFAGVPSWNLVLMKHILETRGKSNLLEIWPNLEVFIHGGIAFEPYREQFQKLIPSEKMQYMETYNASEGFFAIQDDPSSPDMLLMLDYGIFYEFLPMSEVGAGKPKALPLWEIETGVHYAIVISTNGGLWRYMIGDTVMFTQKDPYKLRITGRTKQFINAFGEELIVDNAEKALVAACRDTGAIIREFSAGPIFMSDKKKKGSHEWLIEFEKDPDDLEKFVTTLDLKLQELNSDYEAKRFRSVTLERPKVVAAAQGTFLQWMRERGKVGGQNKVPRLSNNRDYLEELLTIHNRL
ncbi:MAG: GH3 auxin-responsive promoter family protein [Marinilabiliales bacterium]|nr:GH3 auxin-responsive promoter family protein [Marinilabiliales bacterium]